MLQKLFIQNYAIIDELEIHFSDKLSVITGETGAGKSIIAGALGLILGERADTAVLVNKEKKCVVEGIFRAENKKTVHEFLDSHDFDAGNELLIRREIGVNGKSRAFINDTPVNLAELQQLGSLLVDLHQQFDTLELGQSDFQREVVDALADHNEIPEAYQKVFRGWQQTRKEWEELVRRQQQYDKEAGYDQFQFNELEEAHFLENELENIEAELNLLNNAEEIKTALNQVSHELQESETPLVQQLKILGNQLQRFADHHPGIPALVERLRSSQIELQDIAGETDRIASQVEHDPEKIERLNERLSSGYKLLKKHGVQSTNELLEIQRQLELKLQAVLNMEETIRQKEAEVSRLHEEALQLAKQISTARKKQVRPLETNVNKLLLQVGMPNARLKVDITDTDLNLFGSDRIEFLFDANLPAGKEGHQFQPVKKVASGGELSRLMLCLKSLVAESIDLPTMIFDEIDTGISGEAARQVAIILKELAAKRQVICITHQPQIAGKADAHFFVYKEIVNNSVRTNIRELSTEERITTIARMLSGEKPTAAAMQNAREMVMN